MTIAPMMSPARCEVADGTAYGHREGRCARGGAEAQPLQDQAAAEHLHDERDQADRPVVEREEASQGRAFLEGGLHLHHEDVVDEDGAERPQQDKCRQSLQVGALPEDVETGRGLVRRRPGRMWLRHPARCSRRGVHLPGADGLERSHERQHGSDVGGRRDAGGDEPSNQAAQRPGARDSTVVLFCRPGIEALAGHQPEPGSQDGSEPGDLEVHDPRGQIR